MHTASQAMALAQATTPIVSAPAPAKRRFSLLRQRFRPARPLVWATCRAATLPPIDDLAEACAPEGAIYVDGVLFGAASSR